MCLRSLATPYVNNMVKGHKVQREHCWGANGLPNSSGRPSMTILAIFSERYLCQLEWRVWLGQVKSQTQDTGTERGQSIANSSPVSQLPCCFKAITFFYVDQFTFLLPQVHIQGAEEQLNHTLFFVQNSFLVTFLKKALTIPVVRYFVCVLINNACLEIRGQS